jgi:hypothetical protein
MYSECCCSITLGKTDVEWIFWSNKVCTFYYYSIIFYVISFFFCIVTMDIVLCTNISVFRAWLKEFTYLWLVSRAFVGTSYCWQSNVYIIIFVSWRCPQHLVIVCEHCSWKLFILLTKNWSQFQSAFVWKQAPTDVASCFPSLPSLLHFQLVCVSLVTMTGQKFYIYIS